MSGVGNEITIKHYCYSFAINSAGIKYAFGMIKLSVLKKEELNTLELSGKVLTFVKVLSKSKALNSCLNGTIVVHPPAIIAEKDLMNYKCQMLDPTKNVEFHAILIKCSVDYKGYSTTMTRTVLIDPTVDVVENVIFINLIYREVLKNLKGGITLSRICEVVQFFANSKNKVLSKHLDIGFQLVSDCTSNTMVNNAELNDIAQEGMVLAISINLVGLKQAENDYNLKYSNTVFVKNDRQPIILIHPKYRKQIFIIKSHDYQLKL